MNFEHYFCLRGELGFSGLFFASGSFGLVDGNAEYTVFEENEKKAYEYQSDCIRLRAEFEMVEGVCVRRDRLINVSDHIIEIHDLVSRFCLDGNDYDVYTQYSAWQHESSGDWQRLTTQIRAEACGMRGCDGAAPIMGFHNRYTEKNTVFHLIPNAQWQMVAKKFPRNEKELVVLEAGFNSTGLRFTVMPGETIHLPEIIFFSADRTMDLDAYKLHRYYNKVYPRRQLPIMYNSWLHNFGHVDVDDLCNQADRAAEMGFEAFMIDAGWFGTTENWAASVGDWVENTVAGPKGRLCEVSRRVHENSMIFGLWFEPERALSNCLSVSEHPDYYMVANNTHFLDFSNPDAVTYMADLVASRIEEYSVGWVKFDFNASTPVDPSGCGFYRYLQGQRRFVEMLSARFPDLYITNCASGGYRMDLYQAQFTDSFWFSDNQGPLDGLDIIKGTLRRMPTACIERWNVQKYATGFTRLGYGENVGVMFNCNDATWNSIVAVNHSYAEAFMFGGPMGFSCDLVAFPEEYHTLWKNAIAQYKQTRVFYQNATARILVDSPSVSVIQYADADLGHCEILVFTKTVRALELRLYPIVDQSARYRYRDAFIDGSDITENGILVSSLQDNSCEILKLTREA